MLSFRSPRRLAWARWLILGVVALTGAGCSSTTHFTTRTVLEVNQVEGLGSDDRFVYVATGLRASRYAPAGSEEASSLASRAMDALVLEAAQRVGGERSWALVHVTMEEGIFDDAGVETRVVTMRGDVVVIRPWRSP